MTTAHKVDSAYDPADRRRLETAAAPTRRRIERDCRNAPPTIERLLSHIRDHLFDRDLDVNQLKLACGVRNNCVPVDFHSAVHLPPGAYIEDCRLETAARLLEDTKLRLWRIADLVGYSALSSFSRAFARWSGLRPSEYRRQKQRIATKPRQEKRRKKRLTETGVFKAYRITPKPSEQAEVQETPAELPDEHRMASLFGADHTARKAEEVLAEEIWDDLSASDLQDEEPVLRQSFETSTLLDFLRVKSREEGRGDRKRGVRIAELALLSTGRLSTKVDEAERANLRANALAWTANAQRLALDTAAAAETIVRAERALPREDADPRVIGDIHYVKSAIHWYQRRMTEAFQEADAAVAEHRKQSEDRPLVRSLIQRAIIYERENAQPHALSDLEEAVLLARRAGDDYLLFSASQGLGVAYKTCGRLQEAGRLLEELKPLCLKYDQEYAWAFYWWLEAGVQGSLQNEKKAEEKYLRSQGAFARLKDSGNAAFVGLELTMFYLQTGRSGDAIRTASEVVPLMQALNVHPDAAVALKALQAAIDQQTLAQNTLLQIQGKLNSALRSR